MSLAAGAVAGSLAALLFTGNPVVAQAQKPEAPKFLAAQEFRLVDEAGTPRALLAFSASGEPYLALLDPKGGQKVWVGIAMDTGLAIRDLDGKTRLVLSLDGNGDPSLVMRDREHRSRAFHP
jgi:hypothetical protein